MKRMNAIAAPVTALTLLGIAGCSESAAPTYGTSVSVSSVESSDQVRLISRGQTAFLHAIAPEKAQQWIDQIPLVNHVYPNGPQDGNAPLISETPSRVNVQVTLQGKSPNLANDAACETIRVKGDPTQIGAVAIGGQEGGVMISWPEQPDGSVSFMYVCSFQGREPAADQGVILYAKAN